jgi:hypothetical protein
MKDLIDIFRANEVSPSLNYEEDGLHEIYFNETYYCPVCNGELDGTDLDRLNDTGEVCCQYCSESLTLEDLI